VKRRYFRGDAAFANSEIYEFLEAEGYGYAIRLPTNQVFEGKIGYLLKRPVGRPPQEVRRYYASFHYQAGSWSKPRRVVAKVEWHPGELYPRVGFIVTHLAPPAERIVGFYNHRGTCEQYIKEGKGRSNGPGCHAVPSTPTRFAFSSMPWPTTSATSCGRCDAEDGGAVVADREKLIKIGAKIVSHGRYVTFQMAEVAVPQQMLKHILMLIARLRPPPAPA
jgi:hypothetical protein